MHESITAALPKIREIAHRYGVRRLELFGSAATADFDAARSDVDFLVEYPPDYDFGRWLARFQDLEADLASVLGRDVNLVMASVLRNERFRREADKTRITLYDASDISDVA